MGFWWQQPAPIRQPPQDERLTVFLRWIGTVCSVLSSTLLIGLTGVIISLRDSQIKMEFMYEEIEKKVTRAEEINNTQDEMQQKNAEINLRQDLKIIGLERELGRK
jgi:hypothetical protein